ncbi:protein-methionine-sulfoxide reductase heme-binding subunit MsrQ [Maribacter ulvicola]|uniref:Sulfoxide reductase heme-binding subunit YedZ n=1 Tax=Maribacter ulvicola TaxID=228959 RepID=A0A1N6QU01_9FLAO|nr:ferric reductase-like transmembrane domain-containing protein [Maribacter ulvicola]SIQ20084.1 sulfoxide reductase heme-binding subunit YedZ [Maribacter ulvicola]
MKTINKMLQHIKKLLEFKYLLWPLLALPLIDFGMQIFETPYDEEQFGRLMHETGILATQLLILSLAITPVRFIFKKGILIPFLLRNRRYIGVAAFIYSVFHFIVYLLYKDMATIGVELTTIRYTFGWIAFLIMIPLAFTSVDTIIIKMGYPKWKKLQKWAYGAGLFTLLHYALLEGEFEDALTLFTPLVILQIIRVILEYKDNQKKRRRKERRLKKKLATATNV